MQLQRPRHGASRRATPHRRFEIRYSVRHVTPEIRDSVCHVTRKQEPRGNKEMNLNKPITRTVCGDRTALPNGRAHADCARWCVSRDLRVVARSRAPLWFARSHQMSGASSFHSVRQGCIDGQLGCSRAVATMIGARAAVADTTATARTLTTMKPPPVGTRMGR